MSVNKYLPHLLILPEDDANRQIANGFAIECTSRQLKVENEVGGWARVVDCYLEDHVVSMRQYTDRFLVLLIDFDDQLGRLKRVRSKIPLDVADRTFVLGSLKDPEKLKSQGLGTFEEIGRLLAKECNDSEGNTWSHNLLEHNKLELSKLREVACPILWP